jgi:hypothetical protein
MVHSGILIILFNLELSLNIHIIEHKNHYFIKHFFIKQVASAISREGRLCLVMLSNLTDCRFESPLGLIIGVSVEGSTFGKISLFHPIPIRTL